MLLKQLNTAIERFVKRLFLQLDHVLDMLLLGADFGEDVAHRGGEHVHEFVEEWFVETQRAAIAHRAAQDAAQNVVAVGVFKVIDPLTL